MLKSLTISRLDRFIAGHTFAQIARDDAVGPTAVRSDILRVLQKLCPKTYHGSSRRFFEKRSAVGPTIIGNSRDVTTRPPEVESLRAMAANLVKKVTLVERVDYVEIT